MANVHEIKAFSSQYNNLSKKTCNFAVYQTFLQLFGAKKFGEIRLRNRPLEENLNFVISEFPSDLIVIQLLRHDHGTDG